MTITGVPRSSGELNNSYVKLTKFNGEFVRHHHQNEEGPFQLLKDNLTMNLCDGAVEVEEGKFLIVPKASRTTLSRMKRSA